MNNTVTRQVLGKVAMTSRGEYDTSKSYEILDIVTYQGSSYLSKKYNNDSLPTNADDWQLLAQKGDTYELSEEDLQRIAEQITSNANSAFNQNVKEKIDGFNSNANSKTEAYNTNATEKLGTYNSNHTAKLKEYNDNTTSKLSAYNTNSVTKTTEYNSNHTSKINDYNTNASNKVDTYNTNADTRLEEYNTNADTKINEYDEHSKELNNKIVSTRNELERLKSNVLNTGEDTDTFIHLEDSAMAELQEISIDGVCEQVTTSGKNVIQNNAISKTENGITFTKNDDGTITVNGKATAIASINLYYSNLSLKKGDYILSGCPLGGGSSTYRLAMNNGSLGGSNFFDIGSGVNINLEADMTNATMWITIYPGVTVNNLVFKPMIRLASITDDTYEPYTGGQPSPNPDYPQEIKTITDSLKVTSCGKNLVGKMVLGELNPKTGLFEQSSTAICNEHYILYNSLRQYYIKVDNAPNKANIRWYNQKFEYIGYGITQSSGMINKYIATDLTSSIPSDTTPKYFKIRQANVTLLNSTWCVSTDPNYFGEYIESQIQAKLQEGEFIGKFDDTYKDTLRAEYFPEEGQYHLMLDKMIGMGDTSKHFGNVKRISTKQNKYRFTFDINTDKIPILNTESSVIYPLYCNKFIKGSRENTFSEINSISYGISTSSYSQFMLYYSEIKDFTIAQFSDWLTNNPLIIYYILQKPYTLDLGVIDMPISYKDTTNIFTDSDLLPSITAKYYRVFEKTIQNAQINEKTLKQEITDLNATVNALDTRLKALETKTVEEPTESEGTV